MSEQISEEFARKLLGNIKTVYVSYRDNTNTIEPVSEEHTIVKWKEKGYIKQSSLDKARNLKSYFLNMDFPHKEIGEMIEYYEQAIKELQDKIEELIKSIPRATKKVIGEINPIEEKENE